MPAPGISYEKVAAAADRLRRDGQAVTRVTVRALVGTGSNTTISRHLACWRAENRAGTPAAPTVNLLPEDLERINGFAHEMFATLLNRENVLHERALDEAKARETRLLAELGELNAEVEALSAELDETEARAVDLTTRIERLQAEAGRSEADVATEREKRTAAEARVQDLTSRLEAAERRAAAAQEAAGDVRAELAAANQQIRDLRERLEDARANAAGHLAQIGELTRSLAARPGTTGRAKVPAG